MSRNYTRKSLDVVNCPDYRVRSDGTLWSRINNRWGVLDYWKQVKGSIGINGYVEVSLKSSDGKTRAYLHHLMLIAFVGPKPEEHLECRHLDGDKLNNAIDNLQWGTSKEQSDDRRKHGTHLEGERKPNASLNNSDIPKIHELSMSGKSQEEIATVFGVQRTVISSVLTGSSYKEHQPMIRAKPRRRCKLRGHEDEILQMIELGIPIPAIAKKFSATNNAIYYLLKKKYPK